MEVEKPPDLIDPWSVGEENEEEHAPPAMTVNDKYELNGSPIWPREQRPKGLSRPRLVESVNVRAGSYLGRGGNARNQRIINHRWRFFEEDADWLNDFIDYLVRELRESKHWSSCDKEERSWVETWIRRLLTEHSFKRIRECADDKITYGRSFCISRYTHAFFSLLISLSF